MHSARQFRFLKHSVYTGLVASLNKGRGACINQFNSCALRNERMIRRNVNFFKRMSDSTIGASCIRDWYVMLSHPVGVHFYLFLSREINSMLRTVCRRRCAIRGIATTMASVVTAVQAVYV